jgi:hypothetical protein
MASFSTQSALVQNYFTTSLQPGNPSSVSVAPNAAGRFNNDFSAVQNLFISKFNGVYEAYVSEAKTFFIRKNLFTTGVSPYQVYVTYTDSTGATYGIANTPVAQPLLFPQTGSGLQSRVLYLNSNSTMAVAPYILVFGSSESYTAYLKPTASISSPTLYPVQINVYINAQLATSPYNASVLSTYFFQSYTINNTINPNYPTGNIVVNLPPWLGQNYWVQMVVATENISAATLKLSLGGWPTTTTPLFSSLYADDQELFPTDGTTPTGTPSLFCQVELSCLDVSYIGNQSSGRILDTISFADLPNSYSFDHTPNFRKQTLQGATDINGKAQVQYGVTDRNGNPFLSLLALYDITSQTIIEARRRNPSPSLSTIPNIY